MGSYRATKTDIYVTKIARHRNGISGVPFYVVLFRDERIGTGAVGDMIAVVMEGTTAQTPNPAVAVLNRTQVYRGKVEFGVGSYRGDQYASALCRAIEIWDVEQTKLGVSHG